MPHDTTSLIQTQAIKLVRDEKVEWENEIAHVTEDISFNMREIIRQCRKNYWGVFNQPTDPTTGREKLWQHLTKAFVDYKVKNRDLDTKDINFRAKHNSAIGTTSIIRSITKNKLDAMFFGEDLDLAQRQLEIDGTVVWANDGDNPEPRLVNLLNFYIDPTADSIAETDAVIERVVLRLSEFKKLAKKNKWINADKVTASENIPTNDPNAPATKKGKYVELYMRRGLAPEFLMTGDESDKEIPTEILCSATSGNWVVHSIEKRKDNSDKGYEEGWATRIHGRWYGMGTAETLIHYQEEMNENKNIRRERALVSKLGIFQIRKNSGITPQTLSRLTVNGAIPVNAIDQDIKQMVVTDPPASAYQDEDNVYLWSQRSTGSFDIANGAPLPASMPATSAAISNQGAQSQSRLDQEGFGMFLERWIARQFLPRTLKKVKVGEVIRMELDPQDLRAYDERQVDEQIALQLEAINQAGQFIDSDQVMMERERGLQVYSRMGNDRFVHLDSVPDILYYDVKVYVTNEDMDKGVAVQNIISMLPLAPEYRDQLIDTVIDLMGLTLSRPKQFAPQQQLQQQTQLPQPAQAPSQNPLQPITQANTYAV